MGVALQYGRWFKSLGFDEISIGSGGIKLFPPQELENGQTGYSRSQEGTSFCDGKPGSWKAEWLVIGYDTGLGDPIFIDTSVRRLPVMTAMHGEGPWEPKIIAWSLDGFALALLAVKGISIGREYPVALEQNPISGDERTRALKQIDAQGHDINMNFWAILLEG